MVHRAIHRKIAGATFMVTVQCKGVSLVGKSHTITCDIDPDGNFSCDAPKKAPARGNAGAKILDTYVTHACHDIGSTVGKTWKSDSDNAWNIVRYADCKRTRTGIGTSVTYDCPGKEPVSCKVGAGTDDC